jgi:diacylglycerol O-acyltransferase
MNGARLTPQFGMGPVTHGLGLFIAAISYDGVITFCVTADRQLVPDVDLVCRCIAGSLDELQRARPPAKRAAAVRQRKRPVGRSSKVRK